MIKYTLSPYVLVNALLNLKSFTNYLPDDLQSILDDLQSENAAYIKEVTIDRVLFWQLSDYINVG